ncbi:MAG: AAA family ATPase, partial [Oscillospiraceae bacterium]|nr:AAA family ATPase [Oscillospiraceae bacterium]
MYLSRKIDKFLSEWKADADRKPLIIKGPCQVGKTESVRHFAKENYESFIEINFVVEPKYEKIIADGYSAESIIKY